MTTTLERPKSLKALSAEIVKASHALSQSHAAVLDAIGQFDEADYAGETGCRSTAAWLIRYCRMKKSRAYEYADVARKLRPYELLREAFASGELDYSTVRLVLKYITPDNEAVLVEQAVELGYHGLKQALAGSMEIDSGGSTHSANGLQLREDGEKTRIWGTMSAVDGAQFKAALKAGALAYHAGMSDMRDYLDADGMLDHAKLDAALDKVADLPDAAQADLLKSGTGLPPQRLLLASLMGMVQLVRSGMARSTKLAPAAQVTIMMDTQGRGYLPNNTSVPAFRLANIAANAEARGVLADTHGLIINYGRKRRLASKTQMQALSAMWGSQYAMPGCTHDHFIEAHHIDDWANGGLTDLDNLLPLCSSCHSMVSDGEIRILRQGDDIHFVGPDGARWVSRDRRTPLRDDDARVMAELPDYGECFDDWLDA